MPKLKIRVVCAAIVRDGHYLITRRTARATLPLLWEFPGGRVEDGESDAAALCRELQHRLGLQAKVGDLLSRTERAYDTYIVDLHLYSCEPGPQPPQPLMVSAMRWVASGDFERYTFTPADQSAMDALLFGRQTPSP